MTLKYKQNQNIYKGDKHLMFMNYYKSKPKCKGVKI